MSTIQVGRMPLAEAVEHVIGRRPSPEVLWRWRVKGVAMPDGSKLRIKALRCGKSWYCTLAQAEEFVRLQTEAFTAEDENAAPERTQGTMSKLQAAGLA